ncbi:MAG: Hsp20/alpha crystallin family protein [Methanosarcinales archaeon]|nr:MAG: Hsp20/alpha crystallin family protein [Methanosarcinales archaeon]
MDISTGKKQVEKTIEKTIEHVPKPPKYVEDFIHEGVKFFGGVAPKIGLEPYKTPALAVSASEDDENYYVYCDMAGIKRDTIEIYALGDGFTIYGERVVPDNLEFGKKINDDIVFGKLETRVGIALPKEISSIKTDFENGMLKIVIPKYKGRKISIE